ncbi:MAG: OmpA family protein [Bacteroidales bacterium]|jgi:outer membrane protein OmpA-like peptidoglycan-associated protein/tetratricopeptide (TPR) repeat protein
MRYSLHTFITVFLLSSLVLEAQTDLSIHRKNFKVGDSGFEKVWKHVVAGDAYYGEKGIWYNDAFNEYLQAIIYNNSNPELNYKTGVSALFSDKKEEAAGFFLKASELKKDVAEDILLLTGRALQYSGRFSEAIEKFNIYLSSPGKKPPRNTSLAKKCIEECNSALILTKDTMRISIENIGPDINSSSDDYSEILTADGKTMYYASRRELSKSGNRYSDTKFDENIFTSQMNNGSWVPATLAGKNLTTKYCETPLYINSTNDMLYVYAGYENNGDIKVSLNKKGIWKTPEPVPFGINTRGSETSFTISPSGNEIYYVSDNGKGNIGGKDIYYIKKINDRKWSKPQNAGSIINTIDDEESVRFSKTGDTLWFSSKGHNSIGGFDIFYSVKNKAGDWDTVKNYGYPVNTPWDEIFYYPSPVDDSTFYFVSNRSGGFGGSDIYKGRILPPKHIIVPPAPPKSDTVIIRDTVLVVKEIAPSPPPTIQQEPVYLIGNVKDSETGQPVLAKIDVIDIGTDAVVATTASSDADGSYRVKLPAKKSYMIALHSTGFLSDMKRIDVPDNWSKDLYNLNIELIKVKVGKKVVLNNILFETGKSILTASSYMELDRLLNIMKDNAQMKIEISGHTDKTGSEPLNFKLSEARAKAVVEYLVQKGIERSRMEFRGYGSLQPISDNTTAAGRSKNRRVEFKILEF